MEQSNDDHTAIEAAVGCVRSRFPPVGVVVPVLLMCMPLQMPHHRTHTAGNGARAHGARAKAGAKSFFLSFRRDTPDVEQPCDALAASSCMPFTCSTMMGCRAVSACFPSPMTAREAIWLATLLVSSASAHAELENLQEVVGRGREDGQYHNLGFECYKYMHVYLCTC